jgi:cytochrome c-type biogenesis protein CcmH/NrfG
MSENETVQKSWTSVQVYTLSAICLLVGLAVGFLFRGSKATQTPTAAVQGTRGNPAGALPPNAAQPSEQDMKRMADKQVAPLLAQLKSNPNDAATLIKIADYYMMAQQYPDATTYYEKGVQVKPTPEAYTSLGSAYFYSGSGEKAIDALNKALKIDPNYPDALYNLGVLKWQVRGDTKGAIECWEQLKKTHLDDQRRAQVDKMIAKVKQHEKMPAGAKTDKPAM